MYQLYAYGKRYESHGCEAVVPVYPRNAQFEHPVHYRYFDELPLVCLPFDPAKPQESVQRGLQELVKT